MCVRVRLIWVFAVVVAILCVAALPTQAKGKAGTTKRYSPNSDSGSMYSTSNLLACQRSFDPYKVPRSFLKKCGVKTIPLVAVRPLPGGGKDYVYKDGTHMPVPPKASTPAQPPTSNSPSTIFRRESIPPATRSVALLS